MREFSIYVLHEDISRDIASCFNDPGGSVIIVFVCNVIS